MENQKGFEKKGEHKVAIACGGTGGHIYPGIAVAYGLKEKGIESFFILSKKGLSLIKNEGFRVFSLSIESFRRNILSLNTLKVIFFNLFSLIASFFILLKERPKVIIGMGGYPSFPPILASFFLRIPRIIHEQNARMGLANRLLSPLATKVLVSFEDTEFAPKRAIFTGCPIRKDIGKTTREDGLSFFKLQDKKTILVMGGSQGSAKINEVFLKIVPNLSEFNIIWITGENDYQRINSVFSKKEFPIKIFPFIFEMDKAYASADIVISRAGAVSIAEIRRAGIPAILIPYPHSADLHQLKNAQTLKDAIIITEDRLSCDILLDAILKTKDKEKKPIDLESTERFLKFIPC